MSNEVEKSSRQSVYVLGGLTGLVVGLVAAHFYARAVEENENEDGMTPADYIKLGMTLLGLVRQITEIGSGKKR